MITPIAVMKAPKIKIGVTCSCSQSMDRGMVKMG